MTVNTSESTREYQEIKTMARGGSLIFIGTFITYFLGYLIRIIVARAIGPSGYGLISLGLAVLGILISFSQFGAYKGIMRFVSYYKAKNQQEKTKGTIVSGMKFTFTTSVIFAVFMFLLAEKISISFFNEPNLVPLIQILSFALPFSVLVQTFNSSMIGLKGVRYYVYTQDILKNTTTLIFLLVIIFLFGKSIIPISFSYLLGFITTFLFAAYFMKSKILSTFGKAIKPVSTLRELLTFSWPLALINLLSIIISWSDTVFLGYFSTAQDVGIYNAALSTASIITIISSSFGLVSIPVMSELYSRKEYKKLKQIYRITTKWLFITTLPVFFVILFLPQASLRLLFGSQYLGGVSSLIILSCGMFITTVLGLVGSFILAIGKTRTILFLNLAGAVVSILLNTTLIPYIGITGAAIAKSFTQALPATLGLLFIYYHIKSHPFSFTLLKPFIAAVLAMALIYPLASHFLSIYSSLILLMFAFLYLSIYFVFLLLMRTLEKEDLIVLEAVAKKIGVKPKFVEKIIDKFTKR